MHIERLAADGVLLIKPIAYKDERGFFSEFYQKKRYHALGINTDFSQINLVHSKKNVIRGLHYQKQYPQAKLISVLKGTILDVAVDLRPDSATFLKTIFISLSDKNHFQLYIPEGFAHGFAVYSDTAEVVYQCSNDFYPEDECGLYYNDKTLNIPWHIDKPLLSNKDKAWPTLTQLNLSATK